MPEISVDTETNGEDLRDGRGYCQGVSAAYEFPGIGRVSHYLPFRHKFGPNLDKRFLGLFEEVLSFRETKELPVIYHNSKFDFESLRTLGIKLDPTALHYCTMIIAHLIDEERPYSKSLDAVTKWYLNDPGKKVSPEFKRWITKHGWETIPSPEMYEYAAYDADLTYRLWIEKLKSKYLEQNLEPIWEQKRKTIAVLMSMERRGSKIDVPLCEKMTLIGEQIMLDVQELLGGLNPNSPKDLKKLLIDQMGLPILKKTPSGNPSFDKKVMVEYEEVLERLEDLTAQQVLTYRGWSKAVGSSYRPYVEKLSPDGRLRANYKLHGTKTGRLSCGYFQQIPKTSSKPWNGEMKKAFIEDEGWELWEGDYSQLELRLATAVSGEPHMMEVFADDSRDIFSEMAEILGLVRQDTKTFVYATGYGAGINRLKTALGISAERAEQIRQRHRSAYPLLFSISNRASRTVKEKGRIKLWSGRYRHFQFPDSEAHKAFNAWTQGGAADIVERTMWRLYRDIESEYCHMLIQVHDSVLFAVRTDMKDNVLPEIKRIMETVEPDFGVKFRVDVHKWGE